MTPARTKPLNLESRNPSHPYWQTPTGVTRRVDMLAQNLVYRVINMALVRYGFNSGATQAKIVATLKNSCDDCRGQHGKTYRRGQFTPDAHRHPDCTCRYEITYQEERG